MDIDDRLARCTGFDWDEGNAPKVEARHTVTRGECEQVFFHEPLVIVPDPGHSKTEPRWAALGRTTAGRSLTVIFTIRGELNRPLSARPMSRKERRHYVQAQDQN